MGRAPPLPTAVFAPELDEIIVRKFIAAPKSIPVSRRHQS